ncbi:hypothetical protein DERP_011362 [Dermatophagoides pteronyssinus]|uniref:Uncharacterized protein n=1 Tax=Dermatophagoides pteronyssinus TaxID=6956 RepID=A0ABQ8J7W3_DERPT|nr:hypothetical protein DERP_011362 [Dermatophagoides pteronyssinus]
MTSFKHRLSKTFRSQKKEKSNSQSDGHADDDSLMLITVECSDCLQVKELNLSQNSICYYCEPSIESIAVDRWIDP